MPNSGVGDAFGPDYSDPKEQKALVKCFIFCICYVLFCWWLVATFGCTNTPKRPPKRLIGVEEIYGPNYIFPLRPAHEPIIVDYSTGTQRQSIDTMRKYRGN